MKKNELSINPILTGLTNVDLKKEVQTIVIAKSDIENNRWIVAGSVASILNEDMWKDDFDNQKQFAQALGFDNSTITEMKKAYNYAVENGIDTDMWTIGKVYSLSKVENREAFMEWLAGIENPITTLEELASLSDKAVKTLVIEYNKSLKVEEAGEEVEEAGEEVEQAEEVAVTMVTFEIEGKVYSIPADVLASYEITAYDNQ